MSNKSNRLKQRLALTTKALARTESECSRWFERFNHGERKIEGLQRQLKRLGMLERLPPYGSYQVRYVFDCMEIESMRKDPEVLKARIEYTVTALMCEFMEKVK